MKISILKKNAKEVWNFVAVNRGVNPSHVTKISEAVNKMGVIRPVVITEVDFITGKKEKYIVDGQHLYHALLRNNMDIPYVVIIVNDLKDLIEKIALLNASSKNWNMLNYINSWSAISDDYKKLLYYFNTYDFEISDIACVLSEKTMITKTGGNNISKIIKRGEFKIVNEKDNVEILNYTTDILKIIPRLNRSENKYVITEYINYLRTKNNYDHQSFLKKLKKDELKFILATQENGKLCTMFKEL